jgi:hypothetical protein
MLFAPRTSYEYNLTNNCEGLYTRYAANNPPYGVPITYYQATAQKNAPVVTIVDAAGHTVRALTGTNNAGLNRIVWNFTEAPPVKWTGAANPAFSGPDDGATVVPGRYAARVELDGHVYEQRFTVKPDPKSTETLAQMRRSYQVFAKLDRRYSQVDTMLDHLDTIGKAIAGERAAPGSAAQAALARASRECSAVMAKLTANYTNGEDSVSRPGSLRENLDGALTSLQSFPVQGIVTPAASDFYARIDAEYERARKAYNDYVAGLAQVDATLRASGVAPLPQIPPQP